MNKKLTQNYKHLTDYNSYNLHVNAIKSAIFMLENWQSTLQQSPKDFLGGFHWIIS